VNLNEADVDALRADVEAQIARGDAWVVMKPSEARDVFKEIDQLREVVKGLAERVARQAEILGKNAERKDSP
jgi:hypothetical protein